MMISKSSETPQVGGIQTAPDTKTSTDNNTTTANVENINIPDLEEVAISFILAGVTPKRFIVYFIILTVIFSGLSIVATQTGTSIPTEILSYLDADQIYVSDANTGASTSIGSLIDQNKVDSPFWSVISQNNRQLMFISPEQMNLDGSLTTLDFENVDKFRLPPQLQNHGIVSAQLAQGSRSAIVLSAEHSSDSVSDEKENNSTPLLSTINQEGDITSHELPEINRLLGSSIEYVSPNGNWAVLETLVTTDEGLDLLRLIINTNTGDRRQAYSSIRAIDNQGNYYRTFTTFDFKESYIKVEKTDSDGNLTIIFEQEIGQNNAPFFKLSQGGVYYAWQDWTYDQASNSFTLGEQIIIVNLETGERSVVQTTEKLVGLTLSGEALTLPSEP